MSPEVAEISEQLVDEMDAAGRVDPKSILVRFSRLRAFSRSALHYWDAVQRDRPDTLAMRLGRGCHSMALGGKDVVQWLGKTRNGKAWEAFKAEHVSCEILNRSEWRESASKTAALLAHDLATPLLFGDGVVREKRLEWEWMGRACSGTPDAMLGNEFIVDLKTTKNAHPDKFSRAAMFDGYHAQLAWYGRAVEVITGKPVRDLYVVAIEQTRPYPITVLRLTDEAREMGERMCRAWMEQLLVCEASGQWPAYSQSIVPFDVPQDEFGITIGGKAFSDVDDITDEDQEAA